MVERRHSGEPNVASTTIDIIDSLQVRGKGDFGKSADSLLDSLVSESISLDSYLEQCGNLLGLAFHSSTDDVQFVEQREQVCFLKWLMYYLLPSPSCCCSTVGR